MKVNTTVLIKDYDGTILDFNFEAKGKIETIDLTLRDVISLAINHVSRETPPTAEDLNKITGLSVKLYEKKEIEFTLDDISFINEQVKKTIGVMWKPVVYLRVSEMLAAKSK